MILLLRNLDVTMLFFNRRCYTRTNRCTDRYEEFISKILNGFNGWVIMIKVLDLK